MFSTVEDLVFLPLAISADIDYFGEGYLYFVAVLEPLVKMDPICGDAARYLITAGHNGIQKT